MDNEDRNIQFGNNDSIKMSIPERIVLSAGYDGDDNLENVSQPFANSTSFDDTPILNPADVMGGMQTPPSVLTIDHSADVYKGNSPNRHTEGDGADDEEGQSSFQKYSRQFMDDQEQQDDDFTVVVPSERSVVIAGEESGYTYHIPFDDPQAMQRWYTSMQRRLTLLENELDYQHRVSNVWKYLLLTLTVVNPFIINYFFFKRR